MGIGQLKNPFREALLYTAVSIFLLCLDIAILWTLVQYFLLPYLPATTVPYSVGLCLAYVLSITAVFKCLRLKSQPIEFAGFAGVGIVGFAISAAAMSFGVGYLSEHLLTTKCGAALLTFAWNFLARRQLLFVRPRATI